MKGVGARLTGWVVESAGIVKGPLLSNGLGWVNAETWRPADSQRPASPRTYVLDLVEQTMRKALAGT